MTRQEAAEVLEELTKPGRLTILAPGGVYDAIKIAVDALDTDNNVGNKGDTIYRQDAIRVVSGLDSSFVKYIEELPSAQPEQKRGKWIPVTYRYVIQDGEFPKTKIKWQDATEPDDVEGMKCSECGTIYDFTEARNWCSECGADMGGEPGC